TQLYRLLTVLINSEGIYLEPSALAGLAGGSKLFKDAAGLKYIEEHQLTEKMNNAVHISWATGGSMVPKEIIDGYYDKGRRFIIDNV
ncbi:MAG TPA: hypothetical protein VFF14_06160, partial [Candidatus Deferrimicrobium sp.]|nr:hypothetical protein [Candidatus Deferrimicrobium sp.]